IPSNVESLQDGREDLRFTSNITSAELGALQLARSTVAPEYSPEMDLFGGVPAAPFFAATDRYGSSPADSPAEIADSPEYARRRRHLDRRTSRSVASSGRASWPLGTVVAARGDDRIGGERRRRLRHAWRIEGVRSRRNRSTNGPLDGGRGR